MPPQRLTEIAEAEAPTELARLYEDIRHVLQVPFVSLVYRHLATMPGALPWTWSVLRPQILSGAVGSAVERIQFQLSIPSIRPIYAEELQVAGMNPVDQEAAVQVIHAYNRGNSFNLVGLTLVRLALDIPVPADSGPEPTAVSRKPLPWIPPMRKLADLDATTAALVTRVAALHGNALVIPSFYLHLANWPGFLTLACDRLVPLLQDGTVGRVRDELCLMAKREAQNLFPKLSTSLSVSTTHIPPMKSALETFTMQVIPEMIPLGLALARAMPHP